MPHEFVERERVSGSAAPRSAAVNRLDSNLFYQAKRTTSSANTTRKRSKEGAYERQRGGVRAAGAGVEAMSREEQLHSRRTEHAGRA